MGTLDLQTPEEICRLLGSRCRALRLARNLSQAELASMTGSSLSSIRRLEAGGQGTLLLLARVTQTLQATHQFESFLVLPAAIRIADLEREAALAARRRAGGPRKPRQRA